MQPRSKTERNVIVIFLKQQVPYGNDPRKSGKYAVTKKKKRMFVQYLLKIFCPNKGKNFHAELVAFVGVRF